MERVQSGHWDVKDPNKDIESGDLTSRYHLDINSRSHRVGRDMCYGACNLIYRGH